MNQRSSNNKTINSMHALYMSNGLDKHPMHWRVTYIGPTESKDRNWTIKITYLAIDVCTHTQFSLTFRGVPRLLLLLACLIMISDFAAYGDGDYLAFMCEHCGKSLSPINVDSLSMPIDYFGWIEGHTDQRKGKHSSTQSPSAQTNCTVRIRTMCCLCQSDVTAR